jgi:hypothetical protein
MKSPHKLVKRARDKPRKEVAETNFLEHTFENLQTDCRRAFRKNPGDFNTGSSRIHFLEAAHNK